MDDDEWKKQIVCGCSRVVNAFVMLDRIIELWYWNICMLITQISHFAVMIYWCQSRTWPRSISLVHFTLYCDSLHTLSYYLNATGEMSPKGHCENVSSTVSAVVLSCPCEGEFSPCDQKIMSWLQWFPHNPRRFFLSLPWTEALPRYKTGSILDSSGWAWHADCSFPNSERYWRILRA